MSGFAVVGQSPFVDTAVATGPYKSYRRATQYAERMERKGWVCEVVELLAETDVPYVTKDEVGP